MPLWQYTLALHFLHTYFARLCREFGYSFTRVLLHTSHVIGGVSASLISAM